MSKHKNYEMIVSKAKNKSLVIFCRNEAVGEWQVCDFSALVEHEDVDFFLCDKEHESVLLSGLNGAQIELGEDGEWFDYELKNWNSDGCYMSNHYQSRIKPQKRDRWIAIVNSHGVSPSLYESEEKARKDTPHADQFIKIEVEVPND